MGMVGDQRGCRRYGDMVQGPAGDAAGSGVTPAQGVWSKVGMTAGL